jgi:hypothetical protein
MEVNVSQYPQLREEQRIEARQRARENLLTKLGGEPQYEDFERRTYSRYGPKVDRALMIAMAILLLAAFLVSAFHIYYMGSTTYRAGINSENQAKITGLALVILAETAVLLLSVMPAVWDIPKGIKGVMYLGAIGAAFIAAIGNIDVTITYTSQPFDWLQAWIRSFSVAPSRFILATMPPTLTLIVGQGLKYRVLVEAQRRHEAKANYEKAIATWKDTADHIEEHPSWLQAYATSLWDTWRRGKKREIWQGVTMEERRAIVQREIDFENWYSRSVPSVRRNEHRTRETAVNRTGVQKSEQVKRYIDEHPEALNMGRRELADLLSVSLGTAQRGVELYTSNGYHHMEDER